MPKPLIAWLLANLVGLTLFLAIASQFWIEPELAGIPGASAGDAILWGLFAAPILGAFALANLGWLVWVLGRRWWLGLMPAIVILGCWAAAWLFDNAHHGI